MSTAVFLVLLKRKVSLKEAVTLIPWRVNDLQAYTVDYTVGRKLGGPSDKTVKSTYFARLHLKIQFQLFAGCEAQFLVL